ncbi:MAG TPA: hypothetical protein VL981_09405 [Candidatus Methylacidiphilales bacterium]|nr:hypothetical protein [Candidatus Methylacidiphilales bacterium]
MKRFLRKTPIWLARAVAVIIVLLIAFYAEEDWRGAHNWAVCQKELQAKGESLDLRQLIPPGKPEDDLSKVPIFAELYREDGWEKARIRKLRIELDSTDYSKVPKFQFLKGEPIDLATWQKFYRSELKSPLPEMPGTPAVDVQQVLSKFDPELNEIDAAVSNPNAYFPINYKMPFGTPLSGVTSMISIAKILQLKAVAHLENHETDLAERDYLFSFRLNRPLTKGCFLVDYVVIAAARTIDEAILWEGLRRHAWNDAQLHEMESSLATMDMLALASENLRIERASFVKAVTVAQVVDTDFIRRLKARGLACIFESAIFRPRGWWDEDRSAYSQALQTRIEAMDLSHGTLSSDRFPYHARFGYIDDNRAVDTSTWGEIYIPLTTATLPSVDDCGPTFARAETYRRLARLACRLEEYRIAHGQYPDTLNGLSDLPAHLNQEVLSDQPLRYQRKGDGYLLYSLGWNQKDNGGVYSGDPREGDWPWPSP